MVALGHSERRSPRQSPRSPRQPPRQANPDDEEVPRDCISPNADVFSYFMLAAPSERKIHNHFTIDAGMSYGLVLLTLAIQGTLLFCVYNKVIGKVTSWQHGILNTGKDWNLMSSQSKGCNDGGSLCTLHDGIYTCAPPSVQLIGHWDELDLNKDGLWAKEEVHQARESLKCKYAVDPVEVYGVLLTLIRERKEHIWLHPNIESGKGIHKSYFTYIMGDVAMCGYRNEDMCGNLLKKGVFDAPLLNATVPRVGSTIKSALDYCHSLLDQGGLCERVLPSTYATWKIESVQECDQSRYNKFIYKDPSDGDIKSLLTVDYEARQNYETAKTLVFRAYKFCIVFIWFLLIVSRMREVGKCVAWVWGLPKHQDQAMEQADHAMHSHEIRYMGMTHRVALGLVVAFRLVMLVVLLYVGLNFLGRQTGYIDLLLDGVALMFIVDVAEILYARVLREEVKTNWEEREPIELQKFGFSRLASRPDLEDVFFLLVVTGLTFGFMIVYNVNVVEPIYDALQCACLGEGEKCAESTRFSSAFWDNYWSEDVPSSIKAIAHMKGKHAPMAMVKEAGRTAVNLLKNRPHQTLLG